MARSNGFSLRELRMALAIEVTRAENGFIRSQIAARQAMWRDLILENEFIDVAPLTISQLELQFSLVKDRPNIFVRLWRLFLQLLEVIPVDCEPRYRFAPLDSGTIQLKFLVKRDGRNRFCAVIRELPDA